MITFGVATGSGTGTAFGRDGDGTFTVTLPSYTAGQLGIIVAYTDMGTLSINQSWNTLSGSPFGSDSVLYVFWKFLGAGETNPIITVASSETLMASCAAVMTFNGVDTSNPFNVIGTASTGTGTPMTAAQVTTTKANCWAIGFCGRGDNEGASGQSFGGSTSGVTERLDSGSSQGSDSQVSAYSKEIASAGATGAGSATTSATDVWVSVIAALRPSLRISVTQPTETDVAQAIGKLKSKSIAQPTETDVAQAVGETKYKSIAQVTETDTSEVIGKSKSKSISQASETDAAQNIDKRKNLSVAQTTETDLSQPLTKQKLKTVDQVTESETAQSIAKIKSKAIAQVTEIDEALEITSPTPQLGQVNETDLAQPIGKTKRKNIYPVGGYYYLQDENGDYLFDENGVPLYTEAQNEFALGIGKRKEKIISQVSEAELAQIIGKIKQATVAQVEETEFAQPVARLKRKTIDQVNEIDVANDITDGAIEIGQVIEDDIALPILAQKRRQISQVFETEKVFPIRTFNPAKIEDKDLSVVMTNLLTVNLIVGDDIAAILSGYDIDANILQDTLEVIYETPYLQEQD